MLTTMQGGSTLRSGGSGRATGGAPSLNERILTALRPLVPEIVPDLYQGDADEYATFNYNELPEGFGDNGPATLRCLVQVHWYLPIKRNPAKRADIRRALHQAGFTYPSVENASGDGQQHYVFEFEAFSGDV